MEDNKTVNFDDFKKEARKRKREEFVDKYVKAPIKTVGAWAAENPITALTAIGAAIPLCNKVIRYKQTKAEDKRRAVDFYDPRCGRHVIVRRPLRRTEQIEVDRRYNAGESYTHIFDDMRLLK